MRQEGGNAVVSRHIRRFGGARGRVLAWQVLLEALGCRWMLEYTAHCQTDPNKDELWAVLQYRPNKTKVTSTLGGGGGQQIMMWVVCVCV